MQLNKKVSSLYSLARSVSGFRMQKAKKQIKIIRQDQELRLKIPKVNKSKRIIMKGPVL